MKLLFAIILLVGSLGVSTSHGQNKLAINDLAVLTDVKMLDVSGEKVSIDDVVLENGVLVLFSCNACPFVLRWENRFNEINAWAKKNNVGMIVLNSNYQKRESSDSYEEMKNHAAEKNYQFKYVVDHESQIANAFGGQTTPHVFLFDGDKKLVYKGAIDDNAQDASAVKKAYLKDALVSLGNKQNIALSETPPVGCSIKRKLN